MSPTFSAIIPSYNGAGYIAVAIESVLKQTRKFDEIIVSDDNSSDDTVQIARRYEKYGVRVVINHNGPSGFVNGWNNAIQLATCDYISILHQDDVLYPDFLKKMEELLGVFPNSKHLFCPCNYIDGKGNEVRTSCNTTGEMKRFSHHEYIKAYMNGGDGTHIHRCPGVVTHREIFQMCRYRKEAGHIADDDFFYRVGRYTPVAAVMSPLSAYRLHSLSETGSIGDFKLVCRLVNDYRFLLFDKEIKTSFLPDEYEYLRLQHRRFSRRQMGYSVKRGYLGASLSALYNFIVNVFAYCR